MSGNMPNGVCPPSTLRIWHSHFSTSFDRPLLTENSSQLFQSLYLRKYQGSYLKASHEYELSRKK